MQTIRYNADVRPLVQIAQRIQEKPLTASKYVSYRTELNPDLLVHSVYTCKDYIPDYKRQSFSRLRLMSHDLKIETGRRNAIPKELRLCSCPDNVIQNEAHVLLYCPLSGQLRQKYNMLDFSSFYDLMGSGGRERNLCEYIYMKC